jgi:hypothetical protein
LIIIDNKEKRPELSFSFECSQYLKTAKIFLLQSTLCLVLDFQLYHNAFVFKFLPGNQRLEILSFDCFPEGLLSNLCHNSVVLHDDLVIQYFSGVAQKFLTVALPLSSHDIPTLQLLQRTFNNHHQFLKANDTSSENRLLRLIRVDLHLINEFLLSFFGQLVQDCIFFKSPPDKILKCDLIDVIAHDFVESIPAKQQADHIVIGFDSILPHGIVVKRLLPERVSFGEPALEPRTFVDGSISFFDVVKN